MNVRKRNKALAILMSLAMAFAMTPLMGRTVYAADGLKGLDKATVRLRPAGSWAALAINDDGGGIFGNNVVHLYNIGASSRFYLEEQEGGSGHPYLG